MSQKKGKLYQYAKPKPHINKRTKPKPHARPSHAKPRNRVLHYLIIGTLIVLAGVSLGIGFYELFLPQIGNWFAKKASNDYRSHDPKITAIMHDDATYDGTLADSLTSPQNILAAARDKRYPLYLVGYISVPSSGISLPIFQGVSNRVLALGAGEVKQDDFMGVGNYALAGHNFADNSSFFSPLQSQTPLGSMIYVTNKKEVYAYKKVVAPTVGVQRGVTGTEIIKPTQFNVTDTTKDNLKKPILTLSTCWEPGAAREKYRILTRAKLVDSYKWKDAPESIKKSFYVN